jgi:hypothetical protein
MCHRPGSEITSVTYSDIPRLLTMTIVWLLLLVWFLIADRSGCVAILGIWVVFSVIVFVSGIESALAKRRVFLNECLEPRTFLFRLLQRRYLLVAIEILTSAVLALFLMVSALSFASRHWSLIFADVLLVSLLLPRFYGVFAGQLREPYRYVTARRWAMWVSTLFLWLESLLVLVFANEQNFIGLRWQEVITYGSTRFDLPCAPVATIASLVSALDDLGQWSVQNLARSLQDLPQAFMASASLFVYVVLSLLLAYAYSRALIGVVGRPWTMWYIAPRQSSLVAGE